MTAPLAGQASMREALLAAVERSGKLDPLIVAPRRPKRKHGGALSLARRRAKRAAVRPCIDGRTVSC